MRRLVAVAVIIVAAALGGPALADVLIGMAGPITGQNAWYGEQMERGAALAVRRNAEAAPVVKRFRASGYKPEGITLYAYGAVQAWAQAAEKAGSLEAQAMIASLREHKFDTVLGSIDFDDKGGSHGAKPGLVDLAGRQLHAGGTKPLTLTQLRAVPVALDIEAT
jgi:ABC-type branched-subunit amino acid transport system substrate-binding protein